MKQALTLNVNGENHSLNIDPETPLLYVLRNQLELNGPKYGCGLGQCGSCMVLIDGMANPSCTIPVSDIADKKIVTLEGLINPNGQLHSVQKSFVLEQAAQCGYCLNGMVVTATSLLGENPSPSPDDIKEGMQRVLCRCGTHSRFIKAIQAASANTK